MAHPWAKTVLHGSLQTPCWRSILHVKCQLLLQVTRTPSRQGKRSGAVFCGLCLREHVPSKDQATERPALKEQYLPSKGREGSDLHSWRHMKNWAEKREKGGNRCWVQGYTDPSCRYTQEHELKPAALTGLFPPQIQLIVPRVQHTPPKSHTAASRSKLGASLWSPLWTGMLEGTRYPREFGCRKGHFKERNNICAVLCLLLGYSSRCPCSLEGGWTLWRSLPTQIILWFYDIKQSKIH